jgi:hypothetical protein
MNLTLVPKESEANAAVELLVKHPFLAFFKGKEKYIQR